MLSAALADAPRLAGEEERRWDGARVQAADRRVALQGLRCYSVAARHEATGELAAWGFQGLTAVARAYRGRRLGQLVKVAMLQLLAGREPQLERVLTHNSDANQHMIAINTALGFLAMDRLECWEMSVRNAADQS